VTDYSYVPQNNPSQLKAALSQTAVTVAVQANQTNFMYYNSGILSSSACSGAYIDHAVTAVGYGSENGQEYFLVRNSWSSSWGEDGYVRIAVESGVGACGINSYPVYGLTN